MFLVVIVLCKCLLVNLTAKLHGQIYITIAKINPFWRFFFFVNVCANAQPGLVEKICISKPLLTKEG
jgi:hypothetical protein